MKYRITHNLVSQTDRQSLADSKSCVKNAVEIC